MSQKKVKYQNIIFRYFNSLDICLILLMKNIFRPFTEFLGDLEQLKKIKYVKPRESQDVTRNQIQNQIKSGT